MLIGLDRSENHDGRSNKKLLFKKEIIFVTFSLFFCRFYEVYETRDQSSLTKQLTFSLPVSKSASPVLPKTREQLRQQFLFWDASHWPKRTTIRLIG